MTAAVDPRGETALATSATTPNGDRRSDAPARGPSAGQGFRLRAGDVVDEHFEIVRPIGAGGMGEVYVARDRTLGRRVAIKTLQLPRDTAGDELASFLRVFRTDAVSTAQLNHPNIVTIHRVGEFEGLPFIVLEYVDGRSLDQMLRESGRLDEAVVTSMAVQLSDALGYAHDRGVIHRDIKPSNLMMTRDGRLKVLDFGIALLRVARDEAEERFGVAGEARIASASGASVAGTPVYMAPEQRLGAHQDGRSDVWATGVTLYELLTGRRPYRSLDVLEPTFEPSWSEDDAVTEAMRRVVHRCLRVPVRERLRGMAELGDELRPLLAAAAYRREPGSGPAPYWEVRKPQDEFVGREAELAQLNEHVFGAAGRVTTLVGPGGAGKSRLAMEWVARVRPTDRVAGVYAISLSESLSRDRVIEAVAGALGVSLRVGDAAERIEERLASMRDAVIVLDNCEQVAPQLARLLERWVDAAPVDVRFLVTSRRPLGMPGELTMTVAPLLDLDDAIALYTVRAREQDTAWTCPPGEEAALRELVAALDGLPLAIELAAARSPVLGPSSIVSRLGQRFDLLRTTQSRGSRRHATLRAAIDWSWCLLDESAQAVLAQLAVFEGPFTLEAAEELVELPPDMRTALVIDTLEDLVRVSLLRFDGAAGRFDLLATVRAFLRDKHRETDALARRHARWISRQPASTCVEEIAPHLIEDLSHDRQDLAAASLWALQDGRTSEELQWGASCVSALLAWIKRRGPFTAGEPLAARLRYAIGVQAREVSCAMGRLGELFVLLGQRDNAEEWTRLAIDHTPPTGTPCLEARWAGQLGTILARTGQRDEGVSHLMRAIESASAIGDAWLHARCLNALAAVEQNTGSAARAETLYERALEVVADSGHAQLRGRILGNHGTLLVNQGRYVDAVQSLEEALRLAREANDETFELVWLGNLSEPLMHLGQSERAMRMLEEALAAARRLGERSYEGVWLSMQGDLHLQSGSLELARQAFQSARDLAARQKDPLLGAHAEAGLGRVDLAQGRRNRAERRLEKSQRLLASARAGEASASRLAVDALAKLLSSAPEP